MKLEKCINGHFYDSDVHPICPHCAVFPEDVSALYLQRQSLKRMTFSAPPGGKDPLNDPTFPPSPFHSEEVSPDPGGPFLFISYSHADTPQVQQLLQTLDENHYRYWYDKGIESGHDWSDDIAKNLKKCTQFLVVISRQSILSENVKDEIHLALKYKKDMLIVYLEPVLLDGGLELKLDRKQAIFMYEYSVPGDFVKKLCRSLNASMLKRVATGYKEADSEFSRHYQIEQQIGAGGLSTVYLAKARRTDCTVAIKRASFDGSVIGHYLYDVFQTEKQILQMRICPFMPQLIDYFQDEGNIYIVESHISGRPLNLAGPFTEKQAVALTLKLCRILKYFHRRGIIHKDIKPANLILDENGDLYLLDFSASKIIGSDITAESSFMGTPGYAAPEQFDDKAYTDQRTDIFGIGRTLFMLLARPYLLRRKSLEDQTSPLNVQTDVHLAEVSLPLPNISAAEEFHPLRFYNREFHPMLEVIIEKMTAPQKEDRYQTVDEVIHALKNYQKISPHRKNQLLRRSDKRLAQYSASNGISADPEKTEDFSAATVPINATTLAFLNRPTEFAEEQ